MADARAQSCDRAENLLPDTSLGIYEIEKSGLTGGTLGGDGDGISLRPFDIDLEKRRVEQSCHSGAVKVGDVTGADTTFVCHEEQLISFRRGCIGDDVIWQIVSLEREGGRHDKVAA